MLRQLMMGLVAISLLSGCAGAQKAPQQEEADSALETYNRAMFGFNDTLDTYVLRPLAQGYQWVTPELAQEGIANIFNNLGDVKTATNALLQGKFQQAAQDSGRFLMNSTLGIFGIFDVATPFGWQRHDEDFGQTLAVWGVPQGPYVVLPLLGGYQLTHALSLAPDAYLAPIRHMDAHESAENVALALDTVQTRAQYLNQEGLIQGDKYLFLKDAYLQRRQFLIQDGRLEEDPFANSAEADFDYDAGAFAD